MKKLKSEADSSKLKHPETASSTLMKYILECKETKTSQQSVHSVDTFLSGIASTLKTLNPYNLNLAKRKIFAIVQDIELTQIMS